MNVPARTTHFLDRAVDLYDDAVGVVADDGTEYTYAEFAARVHRLSNALVDRGLERGDRVAVLSSNTHWFLEALYAVQQLGLVFVPLNFRLIPSDYAYLLSDSGAAAVVADYEYADRIQPVRDEVPAEHFVAYRADRVEGDWADYDALVEGASDEPPARPDIDEDDAASINYTSGTTGEPKGVVRTHRTDYWNAVVHCYNVDIRDDDVYLWTLPMFHANGWGNVYTITGVGGTHVCLRSFDPGEAFRRIRNHDVTYLSGAPTVLNRLLAYHGEHEPETSGDVPVRLSTAGAAPPRATIEAVEDDLGWDLYHFYGHTESGPYTTSHSPRRIAERGRVEVKQKQGFASLGQELRVVDGDGEDVPRDDETVGEVVLRGNLVMDRYWRKPEETERAFGERAEGWFHSGDLATWDDNGMVTLVDRKKDVIISGGENISSIEIEDVLYDHPGIQKAAVIAVPSEEWGETPKAFVVPRPDADLDEEAVIAHTKERLARYKAPTSVEFVDDLPETATGKVQKHKLREPYWEDRDRMIGEG